MTHFPDYCCFRDDRKSKVGGGVATFATMPCSFPLENKPPFIEAVCICIKSYIYMICFYVPPVCSVSCVCRDEDLFIANTVDKIIFLNSKSEIVLCGDFHRFNVQERYHMCSLIDMVEGPTYNQNQLDYILMTLALSENYSVPTEAPIDNSKISHTSLLAHLTYLT